jgi:hypothetical protein
VSDWGHESEELFRAARRGLSPSSSDRDRVRAGIRAKLAAAAVGAAATGIAAKAAGAGAGAGTAAGAGAGAGAGAAVAAKGITLALVAKIAVPLVIAGAGIAAAPHVMQSRAQAPAVTTTLAAPAHVPAHPQPTTAPVLPPAPSLDADPVLPVDALPIAPPREAPRARLAPSRPAVSPAITAPAAAPVPAAAAAPSSATSGEEAALAFAIDAALRAGDSAGALRLASDHQRRFPRGVLTEEREGARVVAQCMSGARSPAAAASFLSAHPRSPMRARIVAACGTEGDPPKTPSQ